MERLKKAPGEVFTYTFTGDADALGLTEETVTCQEPLEIRFDAVYQDGKINLTGSLHTNVIVCCSRCVDTFTCPLDGHLEEELPVDNQSELDVTELVKEMYIISLPLKPLCREACKGLCPTCGKNRNEKECACSEDEIDHRLADLKKLLEE
ncbi:YceD family protein [Dethiobacter alkaliphilus]|uniref:DUF177 domain-containing protein n=1 Tax=Dethiobacter alkaliphilus AHT 1 TaxID=555088 RepID=C0GHK2_DETAL|nr:YceD family protein [Dethiobacter alkaliphilus]EEG77208.1 protein of unknown function DUF177 [Dethiobacter alkaliphilus AHT 1]